MEVIKTHQIYGFDPNGEPEVHEMSNGSIQIVFNFMPPIDENGNDREEEIWDDFDSFLSKQVEVDVLWEDRELFLIPKPNSDTLNAIISLLTDFHVDEWVHQK